MGTPLTQISEHQGTATVMVITSAGRVLPDLRDLWRFRVLALLFVGRNLKLRFKQSALGLVWVVLQPIAAAGVFTVFFGTLAKIPSGDIPYPIFVVVGLVLWQFFSRALSEATTSLVGMTGVLSKVYLPRLIVPISAILTTAVDFLIVLSLLLLLLAVTGYLPMRALWAAPISILLALGAVLGCALWTSALDVLFRDTRIIVGFGLQFGLFFTPITYPLDLVPGGWQTLYLLNPLAPIIAVFRWSLVATAPSPPVWSLYTSVGLIALVLLGGCCVFTLVERRMMDRI
jgi:homopolymeric O-antigen transport system permease protein